MSDFAHRHARIIKVNHHLLLARKRAGLLAHDNLDKAVIAHYRYDGIGDALPDGQ